MNTIFSHTPSVPLSATEKIAITHRLMSRFSPKNSPQPVETQKVKLPVFCFYCQQRPVEFTNQACPICVDRLNKAEKLNINLRPSLAIFVMLVVGLFVFLLVFGVISPQ